MTKAVLEAASWLRKKVRRYKAATHTLVWLSHNLVGEMHTLVRDLGV